MGRTSGRSALKAAACLGALALLSSEAFAVGCDETERTIQLATGQNVGGGTPGFEALDLGEREVVLTFDDGPDGETTPAILDMLREACVPATFFVLGMPAKERPDLVKRELAEGHAVGGHTTSHEDLTRQTFGMATRDITDGFAAVEAAGVKTRLFRFPKLQATPELLAWVNAKGIAAVGADIDPMDWAGDPPERTLKRLTDALQKEGGGIILLHDNQPNTVKLLPGLLAFLRREGYSVVRLSGAPPERQVASGKPR
jgi:peptidoglycan/xylan/chitin deacetylase (PgdA/CDA1 family)